MSSFWIDTGIADQEYLRFHLQGSKLERCPPGFEPFQRLKVGPRCDQMVTVFSYPKAKFASLADFEAHLRTSFKIEEDKEYEKLGYQGEIIHPYTTQPIEEYDLRKLLCYFYTQGDYDSYWFRIDETGPWNYYQKGMKELVEVERHGKKFMWPRGKQIREEQQLDVTRLDATRFQKEVVPFMTPKELEEEADLIKLFEHHDGKYVDLVMLPEYTETLDEGCFLTNTGNEIYLAGRSGDWWHFFAFNGS